MSEGRLLDCRENRQEGLGKCEELRSGDAMMAQDDKCSFLIFSVDVQGTGDRSNCSTGEVLGLPSLTSP